MKELYVVSYRNSTSNHNEGYDEMKELYVVSYRNSTSNHNEGYDEMKELYVVSYRNSTSNHNIFLLRVVLATLYLIEILHQTTTPFFIHCFLCRCILSKFYIKPQPIPERVAALRRCILSKFYIKPQLQIALPLRTAGCILSKFYIKPQLRKFNERLRHSCILSKFYIKPQHSKCHFIVFRVVSYRNSTSNHNANAAGDMAYRLYLIEILHQTTTLYWKDHNPPRCILSKFYIKPQLLHHTFAELRVVSYRNSTSNHNTTPSGRITATVVSYRNSTSNHNDTPFNIKNDGVVSYRNSTSNHNQT